MHVHVALGVLLLSGRARKVLRVGHRRPQRKGGLVGGRFTGLLPCAATPAPSPAASASGSPRGYRVRSRRGGAAGHGAAAVSPCVLCVAAPEQGRDERSDRVSSCRSWCGPWGATLPGRHPGPGIVPQPPGRPGWKSEVPEVVASFAAQLLQVFLRQAQRISDLASPGFGDLHVATARIPGA